MVYSSSVNRSWQVPAKHLDVLRTIQKTQLMPCTIVMGIMELKYAVQIQLKLSFQTYQLIEHLQFEVERSMELAIICFLAIAWMNIWRSRVDGKRPKLSSVKTHMESQILLWRTAHSYDNDILFLELLIDSLGDTNDSRY